MLSQLEGYQLVGFSDRDRSVLEDVRPGLKRYESNEALLRDPEVDTGLIAANNNQPHVHPVRRELYRPPAAPF